MKRLNKKNPNRFKPLLTVVGILVLGLGAFGAVKTSQLSAEDNFGGIRRFIVTFSDASAASSLNEEKASRQREQIAATQSYAKESMTGADAYLVQVVTYENLPMAVYEADENGYKKLQESGLFSSIVEDKIISTESNEAKTVKTLASELASPVVALGGDSSVSVPFSVDDVSYSGAGYSIAVIDVGVDKNHEALGGRVVYEYCRSTSSASQTIDGHTYEITSLCPNGADSASGDGAATPSCDNDPSCGHGTEVAGAVAGTPAQGVSISGNYSTADSGGVAPGASIIAIKVASQFRSESTNSACGSDKVCVSTLFSDVLKALDWLKSAAAGEELADVPTVAAVNISLGSETDFASTSAECDAFSNATSFKTILQGLKTMKIATTIATGNSGADTSVAGKISFPSCLSSDAVAVAATNNTGTSIASYTNNGTLTTLLAPGDAALPTVGDDNSSYVYRSGTSYAAPIVAGAYAVLREKYPNSDIDTLTTHLESTGKLITDSRSGYGGVQKPLIQLASALTKNINNDQDELPNTDVPTDDDDDTGVIITPTPTPETPTTGFFTTDDGQIRVSTILASLACLVSGLFLLRFMVKKATKKSVSLIKRW